MHGWSSVKASDGAAPAIRNTKRHPINSRRWCRKAPPWQSTSAAHAGNTVVVIKTADWVIDLGPEGGKGGGLIIAEGTPEEVAEVKGSYTGEFLKPMLQQAMKEVS